MDVMDRIARYKRDLEQAKKDRQQIETDYWHPIQDYLVPRRGYFARRSDQTNKGKARGNLVFNNVAISALRTMAAGMQQGLTSPARRWFNLTLLDEDLMKWGPVKAYFDEVERRIYKLYASTNFYPMIHQDWAELGAFGTSCLYQEEDDEKIIRFRTLTAGEYYVRNNSKGYVDTLIREFWMDALQMADEFGLDNLSDSAKAAAKNGNSDDFLVIHIVQPRRKESGERQGFDFESVLFEESVNDRLLHESGYSEFPYHVGRWSVIGNESMGRAPSFDALPDVRMLHEMEKVHLKMLHKQADPPLRRPTGLESAISAIPGGVTAVDPNLAPHALQPVYEVKPNTQELDMKIQRVENRIRHVLFEDVFLMLQNHPQMTAEEIIERREEKLILLGPVIERQTFEKLSPTVERTYYTMGRKGLLPQPPAEIQGQDFRVVLQGKLAQAQRLLDTRSIGAYTQFVGTLAAIAPEAVDLINIDQAARAYAESTDVPQKVVPSQEEVQERREARAAEIAKQQEMEQAAQQVALAAQGAKAARDIGTVPTEALDELEQRFVQ
jgi:hypothetical protein